MQDIQDQIRLYSPHLIAALAILIIGYIVARVVGAVVQRAVTALGLDRRLAPLVGGSAQSNITGPVVGRIVFWLIMLFVLLAFLQELSLTLVTEPLNGFLTTLLLYIPRIVGAGILILVAWIVATILRVVVQRLLVNSRIDQRIGGGQETSPASGPPLSRSLAEAVYYLVFLFFLPAILDALGLVGLLLPVQHLLDQLLGFLPNLVAAILLILIGWFVARLVQRIVTGLLAAAGLDALSTRLGIAAALGGQRLSSLIGWILYILILLPVVISALQTLQLAAITAPATVMLTQILAEVPRLIAAGLTIIIAYVIGRVLAPIVTSMLTAAGFNTVPARLGFRRDPSAQPTASAFVGQLVLLALVLFATIEALQTIGFTVVAVLVTQFTHLAGQVLLGLLIFGIGLYLARLAGSAVRASGTANSGLLAGVAQGAVLVLSGTMALQAIGIAAEIITLAFGLTLGAIAVAAAIAFGVGGRQVAGQELERFVRSRRAGSPNPPPMP